VSVGARARRCRPKPCYYCEHQEFFHYLEIGRPWRWFSSRSNNKLITHGQSNLTKSSDVKCFYR